MLYVKIQRTRSHRRLADLNKVAVRIAHVAPHLGRVHLWLGDEFRSAWRPNLVAAFYVSDAKIDEVAEDVGIARRRSDNVRLIVGPSASAVDRQPDVGEP